MKLTVRSIDAPAETSPGNSGDGRTFHRIGTEPAVSDASLVSGYTFTDTDPAEGVNYYRLKMIDKDGAFTHSNIISFAITEGFGIRIFPNPASGSIWITGIKSPGEKQLRLYDNNGRLIKYIKTGNSDYMLNVAGLSGAFWLAIDGAGIHKIKKVLLVK